jgi:hypothetical protein
VKVTVLQDAAGVRLMSKLIEADPHLWNEDTGV